MTDPTESARLASLFSLGLVGSERNERFDRITRLAARALDMPISLVTLLDDTQQFMCSAFGTEPTRTPRTDSFCTHAVTEGTDMLIVEDACADPRFASLSFVAGPPFVRFYAGASISAPSGDRVGSLCVLDTRTRTFDEDDRATLRDLADLVNQELQNTSLTLTDELTSLANRRAFEAATARFIDLGVRRNEPVSVIFADVNGLKLVNDSHGHQAGDVLLRRGAAAFSSSTRASDVVARLGGDEFAVLLYGSDAAEARSVVDKVERFIAQDNDTQQREPDLSISFGIATAGADDDVDSLVARADQAMYESKREPES
ncbi:MAG: sensor domain-containing diguanylate cyclase, partial [Ilumatobacter sp.]|uniref:GGDEF domain-containing protein n=1 Tax=Ilumatobacter sp. TaxID=1967498 RepID=UPI003C77DE4B